MIWQPPTEPEPRLPACNANPWFGELSQPISTWPARWHPDDASSATFTVRSYQPNSSDSTVPTETGGAARLDVGGDLPRVSVIHAGLPAEPAAAGHLQRQPEITRIFMRSDRQIGGNAAAEDAEVTFRTLDGQALGAVGRCQPAIRLVKPRLHYVLRGTSS